MTLITEPFILNNCLRLLSFFLLFSIDCKAVKQLWKRLSIASKISTQSKKHTVSSYVNCCSHDERCDDTKNELILFVFKTSPRLQITHIQILSIKKKCILNLYILFCWLFICMVVAWVHFVSLKQKIGQW